MSNFRSVLRRTFAFSMLASIPSVSIAQNATTEIIGVPPGATADAFFEINLKGKVGLSIRDKNGPACADLWWIIWPFGQIETIGNKCGSVEIDIPGWSSLAISSKLRARGGANELKIIVAESSSVANSVTVTFP